jgi:hypothetical protein
VGGFGSGRRGGTATAESTASYIIDIKSLAPGFENGKRLMGSIRFDEGRFPVVVTVDLTNEWNCFVELIHLTRDEQRRVPIITNRVRLTSTQPTLAGVDGGSCAREPPAGPQSSFCRTAHRIFGAGKLTALDTAASARIVSVVFSAGRPR